VDSFAGDTDVSEDRAAVIPKKLVMIAGHVNHLRAAPGFSQNRAEDIIVRLRPEQPPFHLQDINDVADEIEEVAFKGVQKVEQAIGAAAPKSKMDIGNPDRADSWNHFGNPRLLQIALTAGRQR
jgi:hypothetical protein